MGLYKILGVARNANKQEIKQAYRKLAQQFHPDKHTQSSKQTRDAAAEKFRQISAAHETLVDDRKRAAYDLNPNTNATRRSSAGDSGSSQDRYSDNRKSNNSGNSQDRYSNSRESNTEEEEFLWPAFLLGSLALCIISNLVILEDEEDRKKRERECEERKREFEERWKKYELEREERWKKYELEREERWKKREREREERKREFEERWKKYELERKERWKSWKKYELEREERWKKRERGREERRKKRECERDERWKRM